MVVPLQPVNSALTGWVAGGQRPHVQRIAEGAADRRLVRSRTAGDLDGAAPREPAGVRTGHRGLGMREPMAAGALDRGRAGTLRADEQTLREPVQRRPRNPRGGPLLERFVRLRGWTYDGKRTGETQRELEQHVADIRDRLCYWLVLPPIP